MDAPTFSVIIPCRNCAQTLGAAISSVLAQDYPSFEVIVMDGASNDESVTVAQSLASTNKCVRIFSQPDSGVYDAINHGIRLSFGSWIYILGSDDKLASPSVLGLISRELKDLTGHALYGDVRMCGPNRWVPNGERYAGEVDLAFLAGSNICQQAIFYRRSFLLDHGSFNTRYPICADWAFILSNFYKLRPIWIDLVVCEYATGGISSREADTLFDRDFPRLIGEGLSANAFSRRHTSLRYLLRRGAKDAYYGSEPRLAAKLLLASYWLRVLNRIGY